MSIEPCRGRLNPIVRRRLRRLALAIGLSAGALLVACSSTAPMATQPLACDDGIKTAFRPDANTTVVAVRPVKKGEELIAHDAPQPITAAARHVPREAAGRPRRHGGEGQEPRARIPRASASRSGCPRTRTGTSASATTAAADGSAAVTATPTRSAAKCRPSSTPTWATHRAPPMPASRGTRTVRSRFCPTARSTPSRFATSRCARWSSRPSRPRRWSTCITARRRGTPTTTAIRKAAARV